MRASQPHVRINAKSRCNQQWEGENKEVNEYSVVNKLRRLLTYILILTGCQVGTSTVMPNQAATPLQILTAMPTAEAPTPTLTITPPTATESPTPVATLTMPNILERVSVASNGTQSESFNDGSSLSDDGRYIVFISWASNLVDNDTNQCFKLSGETWNCPDIFVHDRQTGETNRVSVASDGTQANSESGTGYEFTFSAPVISADGRWVAFGSFASNLIADDTNDSPDVFVHDRQSGQTERVSVADGAKQANGNSDFPDLSADGRYVAFVSWASNLVPDDTNDRCSPFEDGQPVNCPDIYVHDRQTGETTRVSVASDGTQGNARSGEQNAPSLSADGRYVAFVSRATNLVMDDTNKQPDVFIHDRQMRITSRVSLASDGTQANGASTSPVISADGRWIVFVSQADNLVNNDTNGYPDIFVHDRLVGETTRVSIASDGDQADGESSGPHISADGRWVIFTSAASNLVPDDTNNQPDVFIHDRQTGTTERVSVTHDGQQGNKRSGSASLSRDGHWIVFTSLADNLVMGDTNELSDIFVRDWISE